MGKCSSCGGSGTVDCSLCDGDNPFCPACGGSGEGICSSCDGDGDDGSDDDE